MQQYMDHGHISSLQIKCKEMMIKKQNKNKQETLCFK